MLFVRHLFMYSGGLAARWGNRLCIRQMDGFVVGALNGWERAAAAFEIESNGVLAASPSAERIATA